MHTLPLLFEIFVSNLISLKRSVHRQVVVASAYIGWTSFCYIAVIAVAVAVAAATVVVAGAKSLHWRDRGV